VVFNDHDPDGLIRALAHLDSSPHGTIL